MKTRPHVRYFTASSLLGCLSAMIAVGAAVSSGPYVAAHPETYKGQVVGDGQCVAFVKQASGAPATTQWQQGDKVKGKSIPAGTAIATFNGGSYASNPTGNHAAIYVSQSTNGILVWDQWAGQSVTNRTIRFKGGSGSPSNDGDQFYVIK